MVAMDDIHICRLVNRDNKAHSATLRLSRLFSLGVGKVSPLRPHPRRGHALSLQLRPMWCQAMTQYKQSGTPSSTWPTSRQWSCIRTPSSAYLRGRGQIYMKPQPETIRTCAQSKQ